MTLGEKIAERRKKLGYTQQELADLLGEKTAGVVSNWENDVNKPDVDKVSRLCSVLGCPASCFIDDGQNDFSTDEVAIVQKWRNLDPSGRDVVILNLDLQYKRCKAPVLGKTEGKTDENDSVFITKDCEDYNEMKENCKKLITLRNNSFLSDSEIRLLLAYNDGYNGKISIADLFMLFHGMKVPSAELYNDVYRILERTPKTT